VLDSYAAALREIAPHLPPAMQDLPDIVAKAARRVRTAKTRQEAIKAVKVAIDAVHKSIALLKAEDPIAINRATRVGSFVAETLQVADNKLERAVGL
jgi:predicted RNase H-like HicB family nuclease